MTRGPRLTNGSNAIDHPHFHIPHIFLLLAIIMSAHIGCVEIEVYSDPSPGDLKLLQTLGSSNPSSLFPRLKGEVLITEDDGLPALIVPSQNLTHVLNETGGFIVTLLDGEHSLSDIVVTVTDEFDVSYATAQSDALLFLLELTNEGMLEEPTSSLGSGS